MTSLEGGGGAVRAAERKGLSDQGFARAMVAPATPEITKKKRKLI
jgi:hypothetical protein